MDIYPEKVVSDRRNTEEGAEKQMSLDLSLWGVLQKVAQIASAPRARKGQSFHEEEQMPAVR